MLSYMIHIHIVIISALLLTACGTQETTTGQPDWILSPPSNPNIIYGVGSNTLYTDQSKSINIAKDNARLDVAKQLKVTIEGRTASNTDVNSSSQGASAFTRTVNQQVSSTVKPLELEGMIYKESYVDDANKVVYVLAAFNKTEAELKLRKQIQAIDTQLKGAPSVRSQAPIIKQVHALMPAIKLIAQRNVMVDQWLTLSNSPSLFINNNDVSNVQTLFNSLINEINIGLTPLDEQSKEMNTQIASALNNQGLKVTEKNENASLFIRYNVTLSSTEQRGTFVTFANGSAQIVDTQGQIIKSFKKEAKGASSFENRAKSSAIDKLAQHLGVLVAEALSQ